LEKAEMPIFATIDSLRAAVGEELGSGDWITVSQERIATFADATEDHQWIHLDAERAKAGPFGATIAHGYLTLSLLTRLCKGMIGVDGTMMAINYGLNRVRFPAPVPSGSRIRASARVAGVEDVDGGVHVLLDVTVEREGGTKPVCVAQTVSRFYV
jgi:acyl dehydratase